MLFPTFTFVVFFAVVWPLNWITMPRPHRWRVFIATASYVFYACWDWHFVLLLAGSTVINQVLAVRISRAAGLHVRRALLVAAVLANLGILAYFKYWNFFVTSAQSLLTSVGLRVDPGLVSTVLPVGISFFTFMALSYVIDVYRGTYEPISFGKFAVFLSFFPHLVAGPIVRPAELVPQFEAPRDPRRVDTARAFSLIASGLFKKVVVATFLATYVDKVFGAPGNASALVALVAMYAYAIQIYADFSGYTDMAIGIALLLGFQFPQNFDRPYTAVSLRDFWRRWHMTLSRWLRDYLYIPLGGNRKGRERTYANLMITMLLGGLWHGAAWTFVIWGAIHGTGLAIAHWREDRRKALGIPDPVDSPGRVWFRRLATFQIVCLAWVFFRAESPSQALELISRLFTGWGQPSPQITLGVVLAIAAVLAAQFAPRRLGERAMAWFSRAPWALQGATLAAALMVISVLGPAGVAPFIYFQF